MFRNRRPDSRGRERLGQKVVEPLSLGSPHSEFIRLGAELVVRKARMLGSNSLICATNARISPDPPLIRAAEEPYQTLRNPFGKGRERIRRFIPKLSQHFHYCPNPEKFLQRCSKSFQRAILHQISSRRQANRTSGLSSIARRVPLYVTNGTPDRNLLARCSPSKIRRIETSQPASIKAKF